MVRCVGTEEEEMKKMLREEKVGWYLRSTKGIRHDMEIAIVSYNRSGKKRLLFKSWGVKKIL